MGWHLGGANVNHPHSAMTRLFLEPSCMVLREMRDRRIPNVYRKTKRRE